MLKKSFLLTAIAMLAPWPCSSQPIVLDELVQGVGSYFVGQSGNLRLGVKVSRLCDVNGDHFDDVLVHSFGTQAFVIFGSSAKLPLSFTPTDIVPPKGFVVTGAYGNWGQIRAAGCIDFNADGIGDFIVSDPSNSNFRGQSYLVFGRTSFPGTVALGTIGASGVTLVGSSAGAASGGVIGTPGDTNGDGLDDLIIGEPTTGNSDRVVVVFGRQFPLPNVFQLSDVTPTNGRVVEGGGLAADTVSFLANGREQLMTTDYPTGPLPQRAATKIRDWSSEGAETLFAIEHASAIFSRNIGDVNDDGRSDISVGGSGPGSICGVFFGRQSIVNETVQLETQNDASFRDFGPCLGGTSISNAGDTNGDGVSDLLVITSTSTAGVIYGDGGIHRPMDWNDISSADGRSIRFVSPFDVPSQDAAVGIGDINGDGFSDVALGMHEADVDAQNGGVVVFVYGWGQRIFANSFESPN